MDISDNFIIDRPKAPIIKVVGVGGGGSNAVKHMYSQGIEGVSFVVCNTDYQALMRSPVPEKIQLGPEITKGLGAGNRPDVARQAAEESKEVIKQALSDGCEMVFITAGMGGGTGTGAAPVVASVAREMGLLTIGIVTIPFSFEAKRKIMQAFDGIARLSPHVDALLVIHNDKLTTVYPDDDIITAFAKADDVLTQAARGIAQIIAMEGHANVDFADVSTVMRNGGMAIMNTGEAEGENRVTAAIESALNSPLLNNGNIYSSKRFLMNIYCSLDHPIIMRELDEVKEFMNKMEDENIEVIWGVTYDNSLDQRIKITILATNSEVNIVPEDVLRSNAKRKKDDSKSVIVKKEREAVDNSKKEWIKTYYPDEFKDDKPKVSISLEMIDDDDEMLKKMEIEPAFKRSFNI